MNKPRIEPPVLPKVLLGVNSNISINTNSGNSCNKSKIRPKLKAEVKVKSWSWQDDEDEDNDHDGDDPLMANVLNRSTSSLYPSKTTRVSMIVNRNIKISMFQEKSYKKKKI